MAAAAGVPKSKDDDPVEATLGDRISLPFSPPASAGAERRSEEQRRRRKPPVPYPLLHARVPSERPIAAETMCSLFSDRELRVLVKHSGLREGDHSKIGKSKVVGVIGGLTERAASVEEDDGGSEGDDEDEDESEDESAVEAILAEKSEVGATGRRTKMFKIRWAGYGPNDDTWEPLENLDGAKELMAAYLQRPKKEDNRKRHREHTQEDRGQQQQQQQQQQEEQQEEHQQQQFDAPAAVGDLVDVNRRLSRDGGMATVTGVSADTITIRYTCGGPLDKVAHNAIIRVVEPRQSYGSGRTGQDLASSLDLARSAAARSSLHRTAAVAPRGRPVAAARGVISKRRLPSGETEYRVLRSDDTVMWCKEGQPQLDPQLLYEFKRKREERRKQREKAERNQAKAAAATGRRQR